MRGLIPREDEFSLFQQSLIAHSTSEEELKTVKEPEGRI